MDAVNMISTQTGCPVKRIKSDQGTEYTNQKWAQFASEKGIIHEFTPAGCSSSNRKIERDVRTIRNMGRAMLLEVGMPETFWQDSVSSAVFLLNRLLSSTNTVITTYQMLTGRKPSLAPVKIFGTAASARLLNPNGAWTTL